MDLRSRRFAAAIAASSLMAGTEAFASSSSQSSGEIASFAMSAGHASNTQSQGSRTGGALRDHRRKGRHLLDAATAIAFLHNLRLEMRDNS